MIYDNIEEKIPVRNVLTLTNLRYYSSICLEEGTEDRNTFQPVQPVSHQIHTGPPHIEATSVIT
jgi:hypothetical protein